MSRDTSFVIQSEIPSLKETDPVVKPHHNDRTQDTSRQFSPKSDNVVDFDGPDDTQRPLNWPLKKKIWTTALYGLTTMGSTFTSSVISPASKTLATEFHQNETVMSLAVALMMLGFAFGPLLWAPLSELYGRKFTVLIPYFIAGIFALGSATAENIQTLMITRFFIRFFSSAPVTNTGGVLGDIWSPQDRGTAIVFYYFATAGGPVFGPIVGAALHTEWRWTEYISCIWMILFAILDAIILEETYAPSILTRKARRLRYRTGNWALHAKHEEWDVSFKELSSKYLIRPFVLLVNPICFLMAFYGSFVFGILYISLYGVPIQFEDHRGWSTFIGQLPFLALMLGIILAGLANLFNNRFYNAKFVANGNKAVPEARLPTMMIGSFFFCAGLFMFGWTSATSIHWIVPCVSLVFLGFGFLAIFQGCVNYLIDTFQQYAASAISIATFLRSIFAAAFALFGNPLFDS